MAIKITKASKKPKGKMYECQVFFPTDFPKKWKYVTDLGSFAQFLSKSHSAWKYFNVYEKGTKLYLKRFYPGAPVPKTLVLLLLFGLGYLTQNSPIITFKPLLSAIVINPYPKKNTCALPFTFMAVASNGFNNSATIPTLKGGARAC